MSNTSIPIRSIEARLRAANAHEFATLERALASDTRLGVQRALERTRKRLESEERERGRVQAMYDFDASWGSNIVLGLDEVGRGPVAGPLTVGAVVLDSNAPLLLGLNDSKQVRSSLRNFLAQEIEAHSRAHALIYIDAKEIDASGMSAALRKAFLCAIDAIESQGVTPDLILLDGNPLRLDRREQNVVKGDTKSASIAAASIIAKVGRDNVMHSLAQRYPGYGFERNVGYASAEHIAAIRTLGLSPIHRKSFCSGFLQDSLF